MPFSTLFWNWFYRWRRLLVIIVILLVLFVIGISQTIIIISTSSPSGSTKAIELTLLNNNGRRSSIFHIGQFALIPRDTERIEGRIDSWQTSIDITPLPTFSIKEVKLIIERDRNVEKVSGQSLGCTYYNKISGQILSYSCSNPTSLYSYKTSTTDGVPWKNESVLNFPRSFAIAPFQTGLIGIKNANIPELFHVDAISKNISLISLPNGYNTNDLKGTTIATDAISSTDHFLLINSVEGVIYFATKNGDRYSYQNFKPDKKWLTNAIIQCVLRQTTAYCYIGAQSASPESEEQTAEYATQSDGRLVVINFKDSKVDVIASIVPKEEPIDNLYIDDNAQLYAVSQFTLYSINTSKGKVLRTITTPAVSAVASGKNLYYAADDRVFEFNSTTKATNLRFYSQNIRPSTINQIDGRVFINAFINNRRDNTLYTYDILQEQNITPGQRLVDKIPIDPSINGINFISMDYYKNIIHIVLPNFVTLNNRNQFIPDMKSYNESRQEAINYLSLVIPNIKNYTITFSRATNY